MSKTYLVAVDGSDHGWKALDMATSQAQAADAEVVVVHVVPYEPMPEGFRAFAEVEGIRIEEQSARFHLGKTIGDKITGDAEARARDAGLPRVRSRVVEGNPASQIVAVADAEGADMVFLGSRGLGDVQGLLMGSVSHKVMHLAPCTCVAVK